MKSTDAPNILFLMTDQQRPDSLGCYGDDVAITSNLDRLAQEGIRFNSCYVQNPLCCPSRYSILTGRYPHSHGVISNWYAPHPGERSFGHQLGRAGYRTAMIGKMHLTPWHDGFGFDGRIIAEAKFHQDCPDDYERFLRKHGTSRAELYDLQSKEYIANATAVKSRVPQELHIDSFVGRSVCDYLKNTQEPFCVFASFLSPHNPYDPPAPYDDLFIHRELPKRNMGEAEVRTKPREAYDYINNRLKWPFKTDELTEEQVHLTKAYYYSLNTLVDDWIGQIVKTLKEQGLYENTVIVYTSDHGDLLGDHGLVYKQCFYEQSVKAPLIIHCPKRFPPRVVDDPVESIDLFDTLCELGGAFRGYGSQARSLVPLLENQADYKHREAVFSENYFGTMVRYHEFKMVYYTGKEYGELYNLAEDPKEQRNLWDELEGSSIKRQMKDLLLEWAFSSRSPTPLPVRPGHQDDTPVRFVSHNGGTREAQLQPWHLNGFEELYRNWDFETPGVTR